MWPIKEKCETDYVLYAPSELISNVNNTLHNISLDKTVAAKTNTAT